MIEIHVCPICNGKNLVPFLSCEDHSVSHETFSLIKCPTCELLITTPRPLTNELNKYYASPAYTSHISQAKTIIDKLYLTARTHTLKWKSKLVQKNTASAEHQIFDFGCGTGEFLKSMKLMGWQTVGMEPSPFARQQSDDAISANIKASMDEVINLNRTFDAITLWHVLEHVEHLNETIQKLKNLLAQNGTIFIAVPNHISKDAKHYREHWAGYDVPRHLWHFGITSMKLLASRHDLTIAKILPMRLDAYYISLLSEKYKSNSFSVTGITNAIFTALRSNYAARKNMEYSSLIYVLKK